MVTNTQRGLAEFLGTFWLVFGGCGSAVLAAGFPELGIGFVGVSLAFGLTVLTMAYSIGHISGCHLNPAVTFGLWAGGRFSGKDIPLYVIAQVLGATVAAYVLYFIASGAPGFTLPANGPRGERARSLSPGHYSLVAGLTIEVVLTFFFLLVIMGSTDTRAPAGFAPIAIGLALTLDPSDQHPGHQHLGEPGAQHRPGARWSVGWRCSNSGGSGSHPSWADCSGALRTRRSARMRRRSRRSKAKRSDSQALPLGGGAIAYARQTCFGFGEEKEGARRGARRRSRLCDPYFVKTPQRFRSASPRLRANNFCPLPFGRGRSEAELQRRPDIAAASGAKSLRKLADAARIDIEEVVGADRQHGLVGDWPNGLIPTEALTIV